MRRPQLKSECNQEAESIDCSTICIQRNSRINPFKARCRKEQKQKQTQKFCFGQHFFLLPFYEGVQQATETATEFAKFSQKTHYTKKIDYFSSSSTFYTEFSSFFFFL